MSKAIYQVIRPHDDKVVAVFPSSKAAETYAAVVCDDVGLYVKSEPASGYAYFAVLFEVKGDRVFPDALIFENEPMESNFGVDVDGYSPGDYTFSYYAEVAVELLEKWSATKLRQRLVTEAFALLFYLRENDPEQLKGKSKTGFVRSDFFL